MKTGVLVHGCNLYTFQWNRIVWGKPPHELGRVPMGIFVAMLEQADLIAFGTGASTKDGLTESEATVQLLWERFDELQEFEIFQKHLPQFSEHSAWQQLREMLKSKIIVENKSQNTVEEVVCTARLFHQRGIEKIILVSSPTHLPRCLRDARIAFDQNADLAHFKNWLYATPSTTSYMGRSAADVAIFEPPHRPDRPNFNINDFLKRVNDIPGGRRQEFLESFDQLLQKFDV
jgi:hypothetical protein